MAEQFLNRKQKVEQAKAENDTFTFNQKGNNVQVMNSIVETNVGDIYDSCCELKEQYPDILLGSPEGMTIEWAFHNIACYIPGVNFERAQHVDFQATIFNNTNALSVFMYVTYYLLYPDLYQQELNIWIANGLGG